MKEGEKCDRIKGLPDCSIQLPRRQCISAVEVRSLRRHDRENCVRETVVARSKSSARQWEGVSSADQ